MLELKRGCRTRVQTEMVEFNALPFPSSKTLKILAISRRSRAGTARKCTKKAWVVVFLTKLIAFWCCRCRRRRSFVRSLLRSDDGKLRRRFWVTDYFSLLWVTDPSLNENACKITQSCNYLPLTSQMSVNIVQNANLLQAITNVFSSCNHTCWLPPEISLSKHCILSKVMATLRAEVSFLVSLLAFTKSFEGLVSRVVE